MKHYALIFLERNHSPARFVLDSQFYPSRWHAFDSIRLGIIHSPEFDEGNSIYIKESEYAVLLEGHIFENENQQFNLGLFAAACRENGINAAYPGFYNLILFDAKQNHLVISNDDLGYLPLYYYTFPEGAAVFNSLSLFKKLFTPSLNPQGISEKFSLLWTLGEKTVFDRVSQILPGFRYEMDILAGSIKTKKRLSKTWTFSQAVDDSACVEKIETCLNQSVQRYKHRFGRNAGLLLSGGMDSRLVLGAFSKNDISVVNCFHGDKESIDLSCASQAAQATGTCLRVNPMDDDLDFQDLELEEQHRCTDGILNPVAMRSIRMLMRENISDIATGCLGDLLLGAYPGASMDNEKKRFRKNLALALGHPVRTSFVRENDIASVAEYVSHQALKRCKHYAHLLKKEYREMVMNGVSKIEKNTRSILESYLSDGISIKPGQLCDRFSCEHWNRKHNFFQELSIYHLSQGFVAPFFDKDFCEFVTNLDPDQKYDHHLYYKLFRRFYPDLARIRVPNLYGAIDKPQVFIELTRGMRKLLERCGGLPKEKKWINFNEWIRKGNNLDEMERLFLDTESVFEPDGIRFHFKKVAEGKKSLYDGNEIFSFLSLAWLIHPA